MRDGSQHGSRPSGGSRFVVVCLMLFAAVAAAAAPLLAQDQVSSKLDALVAAYPNALADHDANALRWRDGTIMPVATIAQPAVSFRISS